ncbi:threonine ammonia-lyase [Ethanoligenens harbinense]|uniref:threonine ammonia-lyase n=1 Tax=Ethanoligenens harbinense (strain DSM 18485 / JCM 12961 / CGMCC 1.5033 / YUAN-3) TaxID=663278 RepID=E6U4E9_ETHHY|nr:threonine/serine dehydratase [Ethanoligenens harbinense]ADU27756.1 Pyridoxal-5'-phosphate-dependent protein beta subunit [Ethanoligenens harbinense YUAN-3]AVQ97488.1 threonine/serine dehydratase [Ethanoligenens harbinense YUAN-3]AYF40143.1 threonine/serine dehydratase [Ethanoligenens harbinense]AYF42984.1 threonine/serine dehydratase [Ethanoligenens harbinense]QCN93742.1 threonine/serine dehydratase [Ethanoligenens harbinense]
MISFQDVLEARRRIESFVYKTPLEIAPSLSKDARVYLKLECQQRQKSFKTRGAFSKISSLSKEERAKGIIAVSSGNHAAGVSYACHMFGIKNCKVIVPETTPQPKIEKIRYYGATVVQKGENYDEAHAFAMEVLESEKSVFVDSCSDVQVIAGQGTIGLEILEQNPDIHTLLVPIGGGGIITGISVAAKHLKPDIEVYGVQPKACPAMLRSMQDGRLYSEYPSKPSACDALVGGVAEIPYQMSGQCIDDILLVSEESILAADAMLLLKEKIIAEPSSATVAAAVREYPERFAGKNVAAVVTGGNLSAAMMKKLIETV